METNDMELLVGSHVFTDQEIVNLMNKKLPEWKKMSDSQAAEMILFHPDAFGYTTGELVLMAAAIKYATSKGKGITIAPKKNS